MNPTVTTSDATPNLRDFFLGPDRPKHTSGEVELNSGFLKDALRDPNTWPHGDHWNGEIVD